MAYDPYKFVNPSFAGAQNANGAAEVANIQNQQNFAALRDYKKDWWKRGIVDSLVSGAKGAVMGGLTGGIPGALAGGGLGLASGFAEDALDKQKGYQGPGTSSVQASQLSGLLPMGAMGLGKALGAGAAADGAASVGKSAMSMNPSGWLSNPEDSFGYAPTSTASAIQNSMPSLQLAQPAVEGLSTAAEEELPELASTLF